MVKKQKPILSLSEIDHKLQFISTIGVIVDITPTISRSKLLTNVELRVLDETVPKPGFRVKLNLESETLNQFLNVAKRGCIIHLDEIKVTKNEGEVYGEVYDEEDITLYNDSLQVNKWYPGEKTTAISDAVKLKVPGLVKWKKANFKDIEILVEYNEDKTKTRRSALNLDGKSVTPSKVLNKNVKNNGSAVSKKNTSIIKANNEKSKNTSPPEKIISPNSKSPSPSRVTRGNNASNLKKSLSVINIKNSTSPRNVSKSLSTSRLAISDTSKENQSTPLSWLKKSESKISLDDSKTLTRSNKLKKDEDTKGYTSESDSFSSGSLRRSRSTSKIKNNLLSSDSDSKETKNRPTEKSTPLSRLNRSKSEISLDGSKTLSKINKVKEDVGSKGDTSESDSFSPASLRKSRSTSKIKNNLLSSDSVSKETKSIPTEKSTPLSRLKRSKSKISLDCSKTLSKINKVKEDVGSKGDTSESDSFSLASLRKSSSTSKIKNNLLSSDSVSKETKIIKKSRSLSRLNKSESKIGLDGSKTLSRTNKLKENVDAKGDTSESDSFSPASLRRSRSISKIKNNFLNPDSDSKESNSTQNSLETNGSSHPPVAQENNESKGKNQVSQTRRSAANKTKDVQQLNTPRTSLSNNEVDHSDVKPIPPNKPKSEDLESITEELRNIETLKDIINNVEREEENDKVFSKTENRKLNRPVSTKNENIEAKNKTAIVDNMNTSESHKRTQQSMVKETPGSLDVSKKTSPVGTKSNSEMISSSNVQNNSNKERNENEANRIKTTSSSNKNLCSRSVLGKTEKDDSDSESPTRKKSRLIIASGQLSNTSCDSSPGPIRMIRSSRKNPPLNSSDSTLESEVSTSKLKQTSPSKKLLKRTLDSPATEEDGISLSKKKVKLDHETLAEKISELKPMKSDEVNEIFSKDETDKKKETINRKGLSRNKSKSELCLKTNENYGENIERPHFLRKPVKLDKKTIEMSQKTKSKKSELKEDIKNKQTRKVANNTNLNGRKSSKNGVYETYLSSLTKKMNYSNIENIIDISLCDLDEISCPEKFDLQCRVVSEFVLAEEGIQVIRVEDGTKCKCGTLKIPKGTSWDVILEEILNRPTVEETTSIDIIIFNYFRLEFPVKPNKYFQINNIMAVKFQLKEKSPCKSKTELFFCVEGQNANIRPLNSKKIKEINDRLTDGTASAINKFVDKKQVAKLDSDKSSESPKFEDKTSQSTEHKSPAKLAPVTVQSGAGPRKRKSNDSDFEVKPRDEQTKLLSKDDSGKKYLSKDVESFKVRKSSGGISQAVTYSSDETMMEETPPLLREIREIIHEESALGLPLTASEDVHLKNSGSEVTFSQFCEGAKSKGETFRTSTQTVDADELKSDSSVQKSSEPMKGVLDTNDEDVPEDTSKMEPLVYCPSGSSAGSTGIGSPGKGKKKETQGSDSVARKDKVKTLTDLVPSSSESQNVNIDDTSVVSCSSSVKVISSSSSGGITFEVGNDKEISIKTTLIQATEIEAGESPEVNDLPNEILNIQSKTVKSKESDIQLGKGCFSGRSSNNEIEIISDKSSNASLLEAENNTTVIPISSFPSGNVNDDVTVQDLERFSKRIPDRCFYKSPYTAPTLTEDELDEIYDDDSNPVKYFSYTRNRHLPFLTLDVIEKIKNKNSLTVTVTFVGISPSATGSWQETCIKARCSSCDKLYDVYNAANHKTTENPTDAISVGSHILCPNSECCNQTLETPEFQFSVELQLKDGSPLTALLAGKHAEDVFGCSAQDAMRNESALSRVAETVEKITKNISEKHPTRIVLTRENICDPKSGPLYIARINF